MSCKTIALVLLFVVAGYARTNNTNNRDGNWWTIQDKTYKYSYIVGFFDGMDLGEEFSYWGISDKNRDSPCLPRIWKSYTDYNNKYFSNVTNNQIADGLDTFYSDFRNKKIRIANAIWIVVNSIAGKSQEEIEKMAESFRKNAN